MQACYRDCTDSSVLSGFLGYSFARQWNFSEGRPLPKNPILEELYAVRSQIQAEHGDHLSAYLHSEFERLKAGGPNQATNPMHRSGEVRRPGSGRSLVATR